MYLIEFHFFFQFNINTFIFKMYKYIKIFWNIYYFISLLFHFIFYLFAFIILLLLTTFLSNPFL